MADTTEPSDGVPPNAGRPSWVEIRCALARFVPPTPQVLGNVTLFRISTPGRNWHWPAHKSSPNQLTKSDAVATLGKES